MASVEGAELRRTPSENSAEASAIPPFEEIAKHFHLPCKTACDELGIGMVALKKACRHYGLLRWPYRRPRPAVQEEGPRRQKSFGSEPEEDEEHMGLSTTKFMQQPAAQGRQLGQQVLAKAPTFVPAAASSAGAASLATSALSMHDQLALVRHVSTSTSGSAHLATAGHHMVALPSQLASLLLAGCPPPAVPGPPPQMALHTTCQPLQLPATLLQVANGGQAVLHDPALLWQLAQQLVDVPGLAGRLAAAMAAVIQERGYQPM